MDLTMNRYWFLTFTSYGARLPGDRRSFVSNVTNADGIRERHNQVWQPFDANHPALLNYSANQMTGPTICFVIEQARVMLDQFQETAKYRGWQILAVGILADHVHMVVGVPGDPDPDQLLREFKSYASRRLNQQWGKPASETWWTRGGSKRKLKDEAAI